MIETGLPVAPDAVTVIVPFRWLHPVFFEYDTFIVPEFSPDPPVEMLNQEEPEVTADE